MRLANALAPRDRHFFDLFEEASTNAVRAADLLDPELMSEAWAKGERRLPTYDERGDLSR